MVADSLPSAANAKSDNECKIFVGGLAWEFKNEDLTEYFSTFGTVKDVTIKTDFATGNPRGFGFVVFDAKDAVDRVVAQKAHAIKGKKIDPKKITEKEKIRKIFVGGVSLDIPEEEVKTHFEQFGAIEEIVFPTNKETKQRKGFCFITFVDPECCDAACSKQNQKQQVGSKMVDVKKAVPQDQKKSRNPFCSHFKDFFGVCCRISSFTRCDFVGSLFFFLVFKKSFLPTFFSLSFSLSFCE